MKNRFHEFFEDTLGRYSSMRLFSFIALINAIAISWLGIIYKMTSMDIVTQLSPWIVAAFVPKALQKFAEAKETKKNE